MANFATDTYFDTKDNVYRWRSNDSVPPTDVLFENGISGAQLTHHIAVRDAHTNEFLREYLRHQEEFWTSPKYAEERAAHIAEARAVHGPGVELIDVITGRRFRT